MYSIDITNNYTHIQFKSEFKILSSAIYNGGFCYANHFLNYKVPLNKDEKKLFEDPKITLSNVASQKKWKGSTVGMMTAATMNTCKSYQIEIDTIKIEAIVTCGLTNSRRAGDKADYQEIIKENEDIGTINIICISNIGFTQAAMVEAIMIITEARAAILQDLNIKSKVSQKIATGTGTDSIAFACPNENKINFCGKHVLMGEILAKCVINALKKSIKEK